jgi:hypothetical protein
MTLKRGVRLRRDRRGGWLLLAPERGLSLSPTAAEVVQLLPREAGEIAEILCSRYSGDRAVIARDVHALLGALRAGRYVE